MCFGVPRPHDGRRCAGDDDVSPAMANRRPAGAERIASRTARSTWGWQRPREGVGESAGLRRLSPAYALLRRRNAGFGRRERRRRRCGGQRVSSGERGKSPIRVNRGLLGRTRPRRGQRLFTCKRRDAREASLPLRCYAESREGPGLHRQPRPGDRRCVGRPPSASANAGLRRVSPAYAGQTHPGTCLEPGQQVWSARFTGWGPVPHRRAGRQGRLWHCVSTPSMHHGDAESAEKFRRCWWLAEIDRFWRRKSEGRTRGWWARYNA
jgi:hypothetical protein